jgi:hypothetical protein
MFIQPSVIISLNPAAIDAMVGDAESKAETTRLSKTFLGKEKC